MVLSMDQDALRNLLREQLAAYQARNSAYSVRALAKRLDLGVGTVSEVLAGKRILAQKSVLKVLDRLGVGPKERLRILAGTPHTLSYQQTQLKADQYVVLSEWYYLAILNLIRTKDFVPTSAHISKRLGISLTQATQAISRLERVKLIRIEKGKMVRVHAALQTTDGTPDAAIRKSHYQSLERARVALDEHPFGTFDLTWLTFAFAPKDLEAAKRKIREFQDAFADQFSTSKDASEVYRLSMQLFSLTLPTTPEKDKK